MHPVTLGALGLLLVNDLMFKPAWPGAWLPGKLSDFAWMVFAPPVLAYCLSLARLRSERGEQGILAAAYIGLPALYVAFNTFVPIHDSILWCLGLVGGLFGWEGARSPLDPTDSLVIPPAMAVAVWVWRRPPIPDDALRTRVAVLVVSIAALASVATSYGDGRQGVHTVGRTPEGTIGAITSPPPQSWYDADEDRHYVGIYESHDGGWTWTERTVLGWPKPDWLTEERVRHSDGALFSSDGAYVYRSSSSGTMEAVYSYGELGRRANRWAQATDYGYLGSKQITTEAYDIYVDNETGNVILAMGLQGVVTLGPDGTATSVGLGEFAPTDFSFFGKARILARSYVSRETYVHLVVVFILALSWSAVSIAWPSDNKDARMGFAVAAGMAFFAAVTVGVYPFPDQNPGDEPFGTDGWYNLVTVLALLVSGFGLLPVVLIALALREARTSVKRIAAVLLATIGLMVFPTALGAPVLFNSGEWFANLIPVGLTVAAAFCIRLYQSGVRPPQLTRAKPSG